MAWIYLVIAGLFEIGWPLGLKMAQTMEGKQFTGLAIAVIAMGLSGFFLFSAQKAIPMGTAYAVWTGIGAAGTFILGIVLYNDPIGILRIASVLLIIAGVIGLKLAHENPCALCFDNDNLRLPHTRQQNRLAAYPDCKPVLFPFSF